MVVAVRQALDYQQHRPRAIGVCLIGFVVQIVDHHRTVFSRSDSAGIGGRRPPVA